MRDPSKPLGVTISWSHVTELNRSNWVCNPVPLSLGQRDIFRISEAHSSVCLTNTTGILLMRYHRTLILRSAHFGLFIVVTAQSRSAYPLSPLKNPPSIATGGLFGISMMLLCYHPVPPPVFSPKRYSRHFSMRISNICCWTWVICCSFLWCVAAVVLLMLYLYTIVVCVSTVLFII